MKIGMICAIALWELIVLWGHCEYQTVMPGFKSRFMPLFPGLDQFACYALSENLPCYLCQTITSSILLYHIFWFCQYSILKKVLTSYYF